LHWVKQFGATNNSALSPTHLEIDDGRITLSVPYTSAQNSGFFIDSDTTFFDSPGSTGNICISFDTSGSYQWHWGNDLRYQRGVFPNITSFEYLSTGGATQDESGQVYLFSRSNDTGIVYGIDITDTETFLTKLKPNGVLDTILLIYPQPLTLYDIKHLKNNELLIYFGTTLPKIIAGDTFTSGGGNFLAKIDTLGNFYWANNASSSLRGLEVPADGNILFSSWGSGTLNYFGLSKSTIGALAGKVDASTGQAIWMFEAMQIGAAMGSGPIAEMADGRVVFGGTLVDAKFENDTVSSNGGNDIFLCTLDSMGNYQEAKVLKSYPVSAQEGIRALRADFANNLYFGGGFEGRIESSTDTIFKRGGVSDGFFAKLGTPGCFVCPTTIAQFSSVDSFLKVNFDASQSLEADTFFWDFDYGNNICLIAKSDCDADTVCQRITVADSMVGISDLNSLEVSVYPNPSRDGQFTVRTEQGIPGAYELFDLTGRLLGRGELDSDGSTSVELADYAGSAVLRLMFDPYGVAVRVMQFLP
jgi:hypothetical protein